MSFPQLPKELQLEIFKKTDPDTIIDFCKKKSSSELQNTCSYLFKFLLNDIGFPILKSSFDYDTIYPDLYYCHISSFRNKNIILLNCFDESFIKCLLNHSSFKTIQFLQTQNLKSLCFNMSDNKEFFISGDDEEFEDEATEIYKNSFLASVCPLKRGDILRFNVEERETFERNFGKFIYDGKKLKALDMTYDEYGNCPEEFMAITEFPIKYFSESIIHNNYIHSDIRKSNLSQFSDGVLDDYYYILFSFTKNNTKYALFAYSSEKFSSNIVLDKIKNNLIYEAGLYENIFTNDQITKINKQINKNKILTDNVLAINMD